MKRKVCLEEYLVEVRNRENNMFDILAINRHRFATDGKGITTLIGLAGCPLRCKYCINNEIIKAGAYRNMTPEELADAIMIDYCYFYATGGGITFGGGEPLLQSKQIKEIRKILPDDIKINVQTSLNVTSDHLLDVLDFVDELIIDIKAMDNMIYKEYTGASNGRVIQNLKYIEKENKQDKCTIRIPIIPEFTSANNVGNSKKLIENMGFKNIDIITYIVGFGKGAFLIM